MDIQHFFKSNGKPGKDFKHGGFKLISILERSLLSSHGEWIGGDRSGDRG